MQLQDLLARDDRRLLTITGLGGVGKTRLALELARLQLERDRSWDAIFLVALGDLTAPENLIPTIAVGPVGLGLELSGSGPPRSQLAHFIGDRRLLLLLDNFEAVIDAAPQAAELVQNCPRLMLLVTSRERLNVVEESVFSLEGLGATPVSEEQQFQDALTLFEHRAKSTHLPFTMTSEIVPEVLRIAQLVQGSPLGIELAAVWVRAMPPREIAEEIERGLDFLTHPARNATERHRSLRAVFEHSWQLLTPRQRGVMRRLSVFRGGFRREAAREVAQATLAELATLSDKSLLRVLPSGRYDRHPLVLQFAREELMAQGDEHERTLERHAHYFLELAQEAEPHLKGARQGAWLDRLQEEFENFQAVFGWSLQHDRPLLGLRLADALRRLWLIREASQLGRAWLTRLLEHPAAQGRTRVRGRALRHLGIMARDHGDYLDAIPFVHESVAILEEIGDTAEIPKSLGLLGTLALYLGDDEQAESLFGQCLALARNAGNENGMTLALNQLGKIALRRGTFETARALFDECLAITRRLGDRRDIAIPLHNLGILAELEGEVAAARSLLEESLHIRQDLGDRRGIAESLTSLGRLAHTEGDPMQARTLLERSLTLHRAVDDRPGTATCLELLALIVAEGGEAERAARLWGAATVLRAAMRAPPSPEDRTRFTPATAACRHRLGEAAYEAAWQSGERLPLEQAVELARTEAPYPKDGG
jgi:predicted ATPase/Tfp pilus assembly protein PilF